MSKINKKTNRGIKIYLFSVASVPSVVYSSFFPLRALRLSVLGVGILQYKNTDKCKYDIVETFICDLSTISYL